MYDVVMPIARAIKYKCLHLAARHRARCRCPDEEPITPPPAFIVGCGCSGTSILGKLVHAHPQISYVFEPYHMWAAIDPLTDVSNRFCRVTPRLLMGKEHCTEESVRRFNRLFKKKMRGAGSLLIEKTPHNAMRIEYLNSLAPGAKFIHLARDGVDVCYSIVSRVLSNRYKIWCTGEYNQWWGINRSKWNALIRDGVGAGYFAHEVSHLHTEQARAAYEWLVSLGEIDRNRQLLGDHLHDVNYNDLTQDSPVVLRELCEFLDVECPTEWLAWAAAQLDKPRRREYDTVELPPAMCRAFNGYQTQFGFAKRAVSQCLTRPLFDGR